MANLLEYRKSELLAQMLLELHRDGHVEAHDDHYNGMLLRIVLAFKARPERVRGTVAE